MQSIDTRATVLAPPEKPAVQRVVFLGAESSGKTTLCQALAEQSGEPWVEEVGKRLWIEADRDLPLGEYETICREHVALEDRLIQGANRFLFVDTNAITTQFYAFFFFGATTTEVQSYANECAGRYHHTFVCLPDIEFEDDGNRAHPDMRIAMDAALRNDLTVRGIPYSLIGGSLESRLAAVLDRLQVVAPKPE